MSRKVPTWAIFALSLTVVAFSRPIKSALHCPCDALGVLSFNISVDGSGSKANVTCCPRPDFQTGVYVQRENRSNVNFNITYPTGEGNCDTLTLPLTELHCRFYLVCRSAPANGSGETLHEVRVAVEDVASSCTYPDPSSAKIDALQYCQCSSPGRENVTTPTIPIFISSTVQKLTTTMGILFNSAKSNSGYLTPVAASIVVSVAVVLAALIIVPVVIMVIVKRSEGSRQQAVQISRDEQHEGKPLLALFRRIKMGHIQGKPNANSANMNLSEVEDPPSVANKKNALQSFIVTKDFDLSNQNQIPAEGNGAEQCTNGGSSELAAFCTPDGGIIESKSGSANSGTITCIPGGVGESG